MKQTLDIDKQLKKKPEPRHLDSFLNVGSVLCYLADSTTYVLGSRQAIKAFNLYSGDFYNGCALLVACAEIEKDAFRVRNGLHVNMMAHQQLMEASDRHEHIDYRTRKQGNIRLTRPNGLFQIDMSIGGLGLAEKDHRMISMTVNSFADQLDSAYAKFTENPPHKPTFWVDSDLFETAESEAFYDPVAKKAVTLTPLRLPAFLTSCAFTKNEDAMQDYSAQLWLTLKKYRITDVYVTHDDSFKEPVATQDRIPFSEMEKRKLELNWGSTPRDDEDGYASIDHEAHALVDDRNYEAAIIG